MYRPFLFDNKNEPELLKPVHDAEDSIIREQNGIHYISGSAFTPDKDTEKNLNPEFRKLVDSVLN
ncbi:MAG: hypothetical protein LBN21_08585 [Treponema sp.]|jgi:hypothetical protein|nr:hypothetical protein [Treponema sp.]